MSIGLASVLTLAATTAVVGTAPASADGSRDAAVKIGDRVRVVAPSVSPSMEIEGTVVALDRQALTISSPASRVHVARSQIATLEVAHTKSYWLECAAAGAAMGLALAVVASNPPSSATHFQIDGSLAARYGGTGAAGGALLGAAMRRQRWRKVPIDTLTLSMGAAPKGGVGLAMRLSF